MDFDQFIGNDGCWCQNRNTSIFEVSRPVLFLDRDGVIVEETNYLHQIDKVKIIQGAFETISLARQAGWAVVMVTNQAGIGRGYYGWKDFAEVNNYLLTELDQRGALIDAVLAVPHHEKGEGKFYSSNHPMRKPNPGMLLAGARVTNGILENSIMVGDNISDLIAAKRANLRAGFLVKTGHGSEFQNEIHHLGDEHFKVHLVDSIADPFIKKQFKK
jgi:D-glycero-D-manno-heptose 1,7-bisphosphate phosphatase